jgi:hypothetical protein
MKNYMASTPKLQFCCVKGILSVQTLLLVTASKLSYKFLNYNSQHVKNELITRERERELSGKEAVRKLIRCTAAEDTTTNEAVAGIIGFEEKVARLKCFFIERKMEGKGASGQEEMRPLRLCEIFYPPPSPWNKNTKRQNPSDSSFIHMGFLRVFSV